MTGDGSVPSRDRPLLDQISEVLDARERAIRYKVRDLTRSVQSEETLGRTYRKLCIETTLYEPSAMQIRMIVWEEGSMWLTLKRPSGAAGGRFSHEIERSVGEATAQAIVRRFEQTVQVCANKLRGPDAQREIEKLWSADG